MEYDATNIPEMYDRGRDHGPAFLQQWMDVLAAQVGKVRIHHILDLGCGTGRFSQALAIRFQTIVVGIDPSRKMLHQAIRSLSHQRVFYARGSAEALPLTSSSVDMIFISMAFHHFNDPQMVAQECRRVLRAGGRVCLRTGCVEKISMYPQVPFFPTSRPLLEERLRSLSFQRKVFEAAGFQTVFEGVVTQQIAPDYSVYADKLSVRADSVLASLDDREFEAGIQALRFKAATMAPTAVVEPIDFLVFENKGE